MSAPNPQRRIIILGLILVSAAARLALLKGNQWRLAEDVDDYLRLAENLAEWGTFGSYDIPTAFRPPLYPLVLAPLFWLQSHLGLAWGWRVAAIAVVHLIFGAVTTVLTFRVAHRFGLERWSGAAAALVAIDPLLLQYTRLPMTETFAAMFVICGIDLLSASERRTKSVYTYAAGLVLGLGMLCRTTIWSIAILAVLVGCFWRGNDGRRNWKWAGIVLAVALAIQLPWVGRNSFAFGRFIPTTTHGGYTFLLGNNDVYYDQVIRGGPLDEWPEESLKNWQNEVRMRSALGGARTEVDYDAYCYRNAWQTIRIRPRKFVESVLLRIYFFWSVAPHTTEQYSSWIRLGSALFYVPEFLLMIVGLTCRRTWRWPLVLLPAALLSFTLVHAVYWSDMRMRAPIMPAVAILAAIGSQRIGGRLAGRNVH